MYPALGPFYHSVHNIITNHPVHLRDYVCHVISSNNPDQSYVDDASLGTPHSLSYYVNYEKFSISHHTYSVAIAGGMSLAHFMILFRIHNGVKQMAKEICTLEENNIWELQPLSLCKKALECK